MTGITSRQLHDWIAEIQTIHNAYKRNTMKEKQDITDYFNKDWKKYLESEEGKKYLEEINKNYDDYLNGKE